MHQDSDERSFRHPTIVAAAGMMRGSHEVLHLTTGASRRGAEVFAADLERALTVEGATAGRRAPRVGDAEADRIGDVVSEGRRKAPGLNVDVGAIVGLRSMIRDWQPEVVQAHGGEAMKHAVPAAIGTPARVVYRRIGLASPWVWRGRDVRARRC